MIERVKKLLKSNRYIRLVAKTKKSLLKHGIGVTWAKVKNKLRYAYEFKRAGKRPLYTSEELEAQRREIFPRNIKISILVPLYNTPEKFLREMIQSVQDQTYANWELCMTDGSDDQHKDVGQICTEYAEKDERICYKKLEKNLGISGNSNACIDMATGDYLALFDHDDILHPAALHDVIAADLHFNGVNPKAICCSVPLFSEAEDIYHQVGEPDVCIHMAWRNGFVHNSETHMEDLSSHISFLKNMIRGGLPSVAVMGTMHEIGYWEGAIDENTPCNPQTQYGTAKNILRQNLLRIAEQEGCTVHWLRAFYIIGDDIRSNSIFGKIAKAEQEGQSEFPFNTGKNKYDFVDVEQLAKMIVAAATQKEITGIINVCTGIPVTLAEQVEKHIKANGYRIKLKYGAFPDRPYDSPGVWGDATKIQMIMKNADIFH